MPSDEITSSAVPNADNPLELDPATARVQRKLTWLLAISGGIMLVGFLTVAGAIVYRLSASAEPAAAPATIDIGPDVRSATVSGDQLVLTFAGEAPRIEVRRLTDGALVLTLRLSGRDATDD